MGCDIHAYVDYETAKEPEFQDRRWVHSLGSFSVGRDYLLFGIMAGVRHEEAKLFDPKGLPDELSYVTNDEATLFVVDDERDAEGCCHRRNADRWHERHQEQKRRWGDRAGVGGYVDEGKTRVYHPDWHSHSWLTADELRQVIEKYASFKEPQQLMAKRVNGEWEIPEGYIPDPSFVEFFEKKADHENYQMMPLVTKEPVPLRAPASIVAIYHAMKSLEESGYKARLVFWFDN